MQANYFIWHSPEKAIIFFKSVGKSYYVEFTRMQYACPQSDTFVRKFQGQIWLPVIPTVFGTVLQTHNSAIYLLCILKTLGPSICITFFFPSISHFGLIVSKFQILENLISLPHFLFQERPSFTNHLMT